MMQCRSFAIIHIYMISYPLQNDATFQVDENSRVCSVTSRALFPLLWHLQPSRSSTIQRNLSGIRMEGRAASHPSWSGIHFSPYSKQNHLFAAEKHHRTFPNRDMYIYVYIFCMITMIWQCSYHVVQRQDWHHLFAVDAVTGDRVQVFFERVAGGIAVTWARLKVNGRLFRLDEKCYNDLSDGERRHIFYVDSAKKKLHLRYTIYIHAYN